ncbi:acetyl-CoA synthetase-like protein [Macrolepiota fuliginosa MF-IS2]|uniref:Acetyl-CoA synthetase-like protein n=1 Tax=Macrolepiota fuliginosa MF-IS2 TaxID=1400762 RepID=A0A9P5XK21_9AGAR|nr:acetyl-CoA synthetase-like protein [Macrolepiota fuliginosa MF-IS2]
MYLRSLYPEIPPCPPLLNAYLAMLGRPDQDAWPDYTAHVEVTSGRTMSFRQLCKRINDAATVLGAPVSSGGLGLQPGTGEIIGIMSDNSSDYVTLSLALLKIAVPYVLISCYSTPFELQHALSISKATRLFVAPQYLSRVTPIAQEVGIPEDNIYLMNEDVEGQKSMESLIREVNRKNIPEESVRIVPKDTIAYLVFSSGTSGLPKAVMVSHGNVLYSIRQGVGVMEARAQVNTPPTPQTPDGIPVSLAVLPMHHATGLHSYSLRAFMAPARFIIFPRWNVGAVMEAIPKYRVTNLGLVPSLAQQLLSHPEVDKVNFSTIQAITCGASYLPRESLIKLVSLGPNINFTEGYGLSECTIAALFQPFPGSLNGRFKENIMATGTLIPGMEARIVREDGTEADWNEVGELWLRGENVVLGYWNNPEANKGTFVDGWLRTGDRFRVDEDQYFYYADRAKDTLKVSGTQVSPLEIEEVLVAHPKKLISDVTVAGVSGGRNSDEKVPRAWIVLSNSGKLLGATAVIKELEAWHQSNLSRYKWLRGGIEVVNEIPKSPSGKTLRRLLQDQYEKRLSQNRQSKM